MLKYINAINRNQNVPREFSCLKGTRSIEPDSELLVDMLFTDVYRGGLMCVGFGKLREGFLMLALDVLMLCVVTLVAC